MVQLQCFWIRLLISIMDCLRTGEQLYKMKITTAVPTDSMFCILTIKAFLVLLGVSSKRKGWAELLAERCWSVTQYLQWMLLTTNTHTSQTVFSHHYSFCCLNCSLPSLDSVPLPFHLISALKSHCRLLSFSLLDFFSSPFPWRGSVSLVGRVTAVFSDVCPCLEKLGALWGMEASWFLLNGRVGKVLECWKVAEKPISELGDLGELG